MTSIDSVQRSKVNARKQRGNFQCYAFARILVNESPLGVVSQFDFSSSGQSGQAWDNKGMKIPAKKLSRDANRLAFEVVKLSTEEPEPDRSDISAYLSRIGRKGGLKGGAARAKGLSAERRSEIAAKAARERWKSHKK
jgi:hypothetical protein